MLADELGILLGKNVSMRLDLQTENTLAGRVEAGKVELRLISEAFDRVQDPPPSGIPNPGFSIENERDGRLRYPRLSCNITYGNFLHNSVYAMRQSRRNGYDIN